jgi:hypothetical protein
MNMPGFTAEVSLYETLKSYKLITDTTRSLNKQTVVPQQNPLQCWTDTSCYGVVKTCNDHCYLVDGTRWDSGWYVCGACFGFDW